MEAKQIKLAGVMAELGNINFTHLCKYIQCKVVGRGFKTIVRLVDPRFYQIRSIIGAESEFLNIFNGAIFFTFFRLP